MQVCKEMTQKSINPSSPLLLLIEDHGVSHPAGSPHRDSCHSCMISSTATASSSLSTSSFIHANALSCPCNLSTASCALLSSTRKTNSYGLSANTKRYRCNIRRTQPRTSMTSGSGEWDRISRKAKAPCSQRGTLGNVVAVGPVDAAANVRPEGGSTADNPRRPLF